MSSEDRSGALVERLLALPELSTLPRSQIDWLAAHGERQVYASGEILFQKGQAVPNLSVVLSGRFSVRIDRGGITRKVKEWKTGDVTGLLPYSRLAVAPGEVVADEPTELLVIPGTDLREMIRECHEFTALCVHEMLDRARVFKSDDLQSEKLRSLGRLSAGLAHELNNPSSAIVRSVKELASSRAELVLAARELGSAGLTRDQLAAVRTLEDATGPAEAQHSPLARSDREDAIGGWLDARAIEQDAADVLADSAVTVADLDAAAAVIPPATLASVVAFVAADVRVRRLTGEIEKATTRIHTLVAAVKNYTYMDRAPAFEPTALDHHLADTLTLLGGKARSKDIALTLSVEPDLPKVAAVAGELNQVWLNLVDNAIDAAPAGGEVTVTAARERNAVVVKVIDNGPGISPADRDRIFEPFYTTKAIGEGSGLGLDIVLGIVHRHEGTVEPISAPGRTEFRVRLPVAEALQQ